MADETWIENHVACSSSTLEETADGCSRDAIRNSGLLNGRGAAVSRRLAIPHSAGPLRSIGTALGGLRSKMSNNGAGVRDSLIRQLA
jgi:hypothetical protein